MQTLIDDLLSFSRVGRPDLERAPVDVDALLHHVLLTLKTALEEADATVSMDPLPEVIANEAQLGLVFQNLISNAIKFRGKDQPKVHVSVAQGYDGWQFSVSDNGIGIPRDHQDKIFEVFKRLHSHSHYEGTGLGLAICKKIVERHGGRIWVESAEGSGSTFFFTIAE